MTSKRSDKVMIRPYVRVEVTNVAQLPWMARLFQKEKNSFSLDEQEELLPGRKWMFRGQRDSKWPIESSLKRACSSLDEASIARKERELLSSFTQYKSIRLTSDLDYLDTTSLMQHLGIPTRLIDFTESFFVALYFATDESNMCMKCGPAPSFSVFAVCLDEIYSRMPIEDIIDARSTGDYAFGIEDCQQNQKRAAHVLACNKIDRTAPEVFYVYSSSGNPRSNAQSGLFLMQSSLRNDFMTDLRNVLQISNDPSVVSVSDVHRRGEEFDILKFSRLIEFRISSSIRADVVLMLEAMNITPRTLFPDDEGIRLELKRRIKF